MKADTFAPALLARNLAILHSGIEMAYQSRPDCPESVVNLVAYKICKQLLPSHSLAFEKLLGNRHTAAITNADRELADASTIPVLETLTKDGASSHVTYTAKNKPGDWARTAPFFRPAELPQWGTLKPLFLKSAHQFRPGGPPALNSSTYAEALEEVRQFGGRNSTRRTPEQSETATFWSDFSYTETPVGHWHSIARGIAIQQSLRPRDCSQLFYILSASLSDTAIACWDAKYTHNFWRPISAIQRADTDENPHTTKDAEWTPFLITPNHPEYVSGHSAFSGAASRILLLFFKTDALSFEVRSDTLPGEVRKFDSLSKCATECGESRIFGGIHFRFSCVDGLALGAAVADWVWNHQSKATAR